ncbi:hypothetical protein ACFV0T_12400 [Streptomyces sp. NPDC059582]|uniref:hypothetical protein n=1 Tax=Streptomyces sp. NPDC059582 TaxID=3346875 RepID=UPI0036929A5B
MTSSLFRGRPRSATSHISVRVAHTALGGVIGLVWLVLPGMTTGNDAPVAITAPGATACAAAAPQDDGASAVDLVLPLAAVGAAGVVAGYGYVRRTRRARTRTTPGGAPAGTSLTPLAELDERARALLVEADDCVRTSREELALATVLSGTEPAQPYARAVREAEAELAAAFAMRQRYDEGVPAEEAARRHALTGIAGRCAEAGRRLDAEASAFDRLRGPELGTGAALELAEARFRELAGRTGAAEVTLAELAVRYGPNATAGITGYVEQAKDRLVFATTRLNRARQTADRGEPGRAAVHLRAAEGAVAQAAVFVDEVHRLATDLATAAQWLPAALTGAEAAIAPVRARTTGAVPDPGAAVGKLRSRLLHADAVLDSIRQEVTARRPYDPLDLLRRVVRATTPLGAGRGGVLAAAASLVARDATAGAGGFVATHRGAVGAEARTRLAAARRRLAAADRSTSGAPTATGLLATGTTDAPATADLIATDTTPTVAPFPTSDARARANTDQTAADLPAAHGPTTSNLSAAHGPTTADPLPAGDPATTHRPATGGPAATDPFAADDPATADLLAADDLARQARHLAEQDVRTHGNPHDRVVAHQSGLAGAVLGGVLLGGAAPDGTPSSFGGPRTRGRRGTAPA